MSQLLRALQYASVGIIRQYRSYLAPSARRMFQTNPIVDAKCQSLSQNAPKKDLLNTNAKKDLLNTNAKNYLRNTYTKNYLCEWTINRHLHDDSRKHESKVEGSERRKIRKILIANRSEIAIRIARACAELRIEPVGLYSQEDKLSSHRQYMTRSFLIGEGCSPIEAYLNISEIICIAEKNNCDAIHPGYGFLSEREDFAQKVIANGLEFIGPRPEVLKILGDKSTARDAAEHSQVPIIPGSPVSSVQDVQKFCESYGCPVILKAAYGGGGRGMRLVQTEMDIEENFQRAKSEAKAAFGKDDLLIEKYIESPRHIEVQILGDKYGDVVHLYERDCTMQRRFQKVIQVAPAQDLSPEVRKKITGYSVKLAKQIKYSNAGTVEFLIDKSNNVYFIEVNPRVQVEHTLSEIITGVDIIHSQIKIAEGNHLSEIGIQQEKIRASGCAIQCHIRTEDPTKNFQPSTGRLDYINVPSGYGIRVDSCNPYAGQYISPDYDSLLAKVITFGPDYQFCLDKMRRALQEFTASGLVTNLPFLLNVFENKDFLSGKALQTSFIDDNPSLLVRASFSHTSRGEKILKFLAETLVNGSKTPFKSRCQPSSINSEIQVNVWSCDGIEENNKYSRWEKVEKGLRKILKVGGTLEFIKHVRNTKSLMLMDTTFRDAHQSLLATRMRTYDLAKVSPFVSNKFPQLFAIEMWGGAVPHIALKYLYECPWERLVELRELIPDIPFAMLLRGKSLVGYENYNAEDVEEFCRLAVLGGIDIFRIFDAFNNVTNILEGIKAIEKAAFKCNVNVLVEAAICYTGDITHTGKVNEYSMEYYENIADKLVVAGVRALCIKDMAGLLKPLAARMLVSSLRKKYPEIILHVHTHDTAGSAVATSIASVEAGADVIDVCSDAMANGSSQPPMGTIIAAFDNTLKRTGIDLKSVASYNAYWAQVRELYEVFECKDLKSARSETYQHEIPGGQYSNLFLQSIMLNLDFEKVKSAYQDANALLGNIIKVTPSSTIVADLAIFMAQKNVSSSDLENKLDTLQLPRSVMEYFQGSIGEPHQGFPAELKKKIMEKVSPYTPRKISSSTDKDILKGITLNGQKENENSATKLNLLMFPKETANYLKFKELYDRIDKLPTSVFLRGPKLGEEIKIEFERGDIAFIKTLAISEKPNDRGERAVFFLYNGQARTVIVRDSSADLTSNVKARPDVMGEVGAPMPGKVIKIAVGENKSVQKGDVLVVLYAMKTEVQIQSPIDGMVSQVHVLKDSEVQTDDLLVTIAHD